VHERLGATMTDFAGWLMPLRYTSETAEHTAVRSSAGLFDLSHMGEIAVTGPGAGVALDYAVCGWPSALAPGRARYTMLCAVDGGVLDDLVIYRQGPERFMVVANAANTGVVLAELQKRSAVSSGAQVQDETAATGLIAIQGPNAAGILSTVTDLDLADMRYYAGAYGTVAGCRVWVARTGYTGEDGFEIFCAPQDCERIWMALTQAGETLLGPGDALLAPGGTTPRPPESTDGLMPAGLAARDTLRLEAGMPLYGNELGRNMTPYEAGLGRVVRLDKPSDFVGRKALAARSAEGPRQVLIGLVAKSRRVPRHGYPVMAQTGQRVGVVTSGARSPTLRTSIAMAYVETGATTPFGIDIRGSEEPAEVTELPFYDRSKQG
jgi:aminomethyltransferase